MSRPGAFVDSARTRRTVIPESDAINTTTMTATTAKFATSGAMTDSEKVWSGFLLKYLRSAPARVSLIRFKLRKS